MEVSGAQVTGSVESRWVARRRGAQKELTKQQKGIWSAGRESGDTVDLRESAAAEGPSMRMYKAESRALTTDAEEPATDIGLEMFSRWWPEQYWEEELWIQKMSFETVKL